MGKIHHPLQLWTDLASNIIHEEHQTEMAPLLKWLQVTMSEVLDMDNQLVDPPVQLGNYKITFPAWWGHTLQEFALEHLLVGGGLSTLVS